MAANNVVRDFGGYDEMVEFFAFTDLYGEADWDAPERLNIAHEACDRHADGSTPALQHVATDGTHTELTYADLADGSNRVANLLEDLGVDRGDRVFTYLPRIPAHFELFLGTLKRGAVFGAINERYGTEGIRYRVEDSEATVLVTTATHLDVVDAAIRDADALTDLLAVGDVDASAVESDVRVRPFGDAVADRSADYEPAELAADDTALLYYTSGTTGRPKGVVLNHSWLTMAAAVARYVEDLTSEDLYWSTGDMGWLTGPLHCLGPWFWGGEVFVYEGQFDSERWAELLADYDVDVLHTVPTVLRSFREDADVVTSKDIELRHATTVGEPLEPVVVEWIEDNLGVTVHDTYGQTECGGVVISNLPAIPVKPGSMGRPLPGAEVALVDPETGEEVGTGETGEIAWNDSPAYFEGYWQQPDRKAESTVNGWYLAGDLAHRDADGYFWFEGRADDVILSAGHRIGPFEVERAIAEHPAVAEAAVVPKHDERRGNIVKAFVTPSGGTDPSEALKDEIADSVRETLSAHEYPREIEFRDELPKTVTGKIKRTELREDVD